MKVTALTMLVLSGIAAACGSNGQAESNVMREGAHQGRDGRPQFIGPLPEPTVITCYDATKSQTVGQLKEKITAVNLKAPDAARFESERYIFSISSSKVSLLSLELIDKSTGDKVSAEQVDKNTLEARLTSDEAPEEPVIQSVSGLGSQSVQLKALSGDFAKALFAAQNVSISLETDEGNVTKVICY